MKDQNQSFRNNTLTGEMSPLRRIDTSLRTSSRKVSIMKNEFATTKGGSLMGRVVTVAANGLIRALGKECRVFDMQQHCARKEIVLGGKTSFSDQCYCSTSLRLPHAHGVFDVFANLGIPTIPFLFGFVNIRRIYPGWQSQPTPLRF